MLFRSADVLNLALPDHFIHHGKRDVLLAEAGLDADGIERQIRERLSRQQTLREARER